MKSSPAAESEAETPPVSAAVAEALARLEECARVLSGLSSKGKRQARNRRYYLKRKARKARKASESVLKASESDGGAAVETHRGLAWYHMPGRRESKRMTFALFKRDQWPPANWKVPARLRGAELMLLLHERASLCNVKKKKGGAA